MLNQEVNTSIYSTPHTILPHMEGIALFMYSPGELVASGLKERLLIWSQEISLGMQYLSSIGFIHRDLASRNILVTTDKKCKVMELVH